jgi:hypothetical protein
MQVGGYSRAKSVPELSGFEVLEALEEHEIPHDVWNSIDRKPLLPQKP